MFSRSCLPPTKTEKGFSLSFVSQYQSDNRETNDKLSPLYTLSTMINIFHDKHGYLKPLPKEFLTTGKYLNYLTT